MKKWHLITKRCHSSLEKSQHFKNNIELRIFVCIKIEIEFNISDELLKFFKKGKNNSKRMKDMVLMNGSFEYQNVKIKKKKLC